MSSERIYYNKNFENKQSFGPKVHIQFIISTYINNILKPNKLRSRLIAICGKTNQCYIETNERFHLRSKNLRNRCAA